MAEKIEPLDAAKTYMIAELSRIFPAPEIQSELIKGLDSLSEKELWRFLEALSFTYRLNEMFWHLSDTGFTWRKEEVAYERIVLTGMNPLIDALTHGEIVQNDPIKFRDYLLDYFVKHPSDDPEGLAQFRPSGRAIQYSTIFLREENEKLSLLDGSNRFIAILLKGGTKINAIIGTKTGDEKTRIGDSTFLLLRKLYERGDEAEKQSVLSVTKKLMQESVDGTNAVEEYWVRHVMDEEIKKIGRLLLSQFVAQ